MADVSKDQGDSPSRRPALRPFSGRTQGAGQGALRPMGARRPAVSPLAAVSAPTPSGDVSPIAEPAPAAASGDQGQAPDDAVVAATELVAGPSLAVAAPPAEVIGEGEAIAGRSDALAIDGMPADDVTEAASEPPSALDVSTLEPDATGNRELVTYESPYEDVAFGVARGDMADRGDAEGAHETSATATAWDGHTDDLHDAGPSATGAAASADDGAEACLEAGPAVGMELETVACDDVAREGSASDGPASEGWARDDAASAGDGQRFAAAEMSPEPAGAGEVPQVAPLMTGGFAEFVVDDSAYAAMDDDLPFRRTVDVPDDAEPAMTAPSSAFESTDSDPDRERQERAAAPYTPPALVAAGDGVLNLEDAFPQWEGTGNASEVAASADDDASPGADASQSTAGDPPGRAPAWGQEAARSHAAELLQMVAERVRRGEIVASTDANASPEAVLASVLASLLSART